MTIKPGDTLPDATFSRMGADGPEQVALGDLTKGRKVVLFAVPGAFTPTCHSAHVPSFIRTKDEFAAKGVDEIICLSVATTRSCMKAWGDATGAAEAGLTLLSDGTGAFTAEIGMKFRRAAPFGLMPGVPSAYANAGRGWGGQAASCPKNLAPGTCDVSKVARRCWRRCNGGWRGAFGHACRVAERDQAAQDWDACACPEAATGRPADPFTTYRFLHALEGVRVRRHRHGVGAALHHRRTGRGVDCGSPPHYGEIAFSGRIHFFDHAFAQAYTRAGGQYYPKLQLAVPFYPCHLSKRFLRANRGGMRNRVFFPTAAILQAALCAAGMTRRQSAVLGACDLLHRRGSRARGRTRVPAPGKRNSFHWENQGAIPALTVVLCPRCPRSQAQDLIRKERATAQAFGGVIRAYTGDDLRPEHWDAFWQFYQDTGARKWGTPYLTRAFFDTVQDTMRDDVLLVMAERDGTPIAGALNFIGRDCLYGRYWGCLDDHSCLHFELCYYQAMDFAIEHGLARGRSRGARHA